ncbi:MAG: hypothetical protein ACRBN8_04595 [Nannocystales bacterium]
MDSVGTSGEFSGSSGEDESSGAADDQDPIYDVGNAGGGDKLPPSEDGCTKVDLLFVIDNSGSMAGEQENLVNSVPGFISTMRETLIDADSLHIGVTTTDANTGNASPCNVDGALVTRTSGADSSQTTCGPYGSGGPFMTEDDELEVAFACAAQVGTEGIPFERPMDTLRAAITPGMNGAGECNDGFIRDDALLVAVVITDEEDHLSSNVIQNGSADEPPKWFTDVVALKGGIEENIVLLSLVGNPSPSACDGLTGDDEGAQVADRLIEFTEMFTYGTTGDVCAPSYVPFFEEAVSVIDLACDGFTPAG